MTDLIDRYAARCVVGEFGGEGFGAADFVRFDRRRGVSTPTLNGLAEFEANMRAIFEVFDTFTTEPVAIRGNRVALIRLHLARDGFATTMLGVYEADERGLLTRGTSFDEDDFDLALDELEERFIVGEGAEHEYLIRRARDFTRSLASLDGAATLGFMSPNVEFVDHRRLGLGAMGIDGIRGVLAARAEQVTEDISFFRDLSVRGDAVLGLLDSRGVDAYGTAVLYEMHWVARFVAGRIVFTAWYDVDDHTAAWAKFEELAAETRTPHVDNAVVREVVRGVWRQEFDPSFDAVAEMEAGTAADVVIDDRRRGVSIGVLRGREEMHDNVRAQDELFGPTTFEPIAVRGDHLALLRTLAVSATGFELVSLAIAETNDAGKFCSWTFFDESDLGLAVDTLDARHAAIRADTPGPAELGFTRERAAFARGDWEEVARCYAPDFVAIDHRPLGFAPATAEEYLARSRELVASAPELHGFAPKSYYAPRVCLAAATFVGTGTEGSEYEWNLVMLAHADDQGRYLRLEYFPEDQWAEALALFDEWSPRT